jgi:uncharacterized protein with NRDE domain
VCTLALYFRIFEEFPLLVAANRDEHYDRASAPPNVLGTKPRIFAGRDLRAGGTWLGVNDRGLLVGILNRKGSGWQGTQQTLRSRGLLCLDLLGSATPSEACELLCAQENVAYQPFTIVFANENAAWVAHNSAAGIVPARLDAGLHVFSNSGELDAGSEKVTRAYRRFATLIDFSQGCFDPPANIVSRLAQILGDHTAANGANSANEAICVHGNVSGTVSSSIIRYSRSAREFQNFYSAGAPCQSPFVPQPSLSVR